LDNKVVGWDESSAGEQFRARATDGSLESSSATDDGVVDSVASSEKRKKGIAVVLRCGGIQWGTRGRHVKRSRRTLQKTREVDRVVNAAADGACWWAFVDGGCRRISRSLRARL